MTCHDSMQGIMKAAHAKVLQDFAEGRVFELDTLTLDKVGYRTNGDGMNRGAQPSFAGGKVSMVQSCIKVSRGGSRAV